MYTLIMPCGNISKFMQHLMLYYIEIYIIQYGQYHGSWIPEYWCSGTPLSRLGKSHHNHTNCVIWLTKSLKISVCLFQNSYLTPHEKLPQILDPSPQWHCFIYIRKYWDFSRYHLSFWMRSSCLKDYTKSLICIVNTVSAAALAPWGARASAGTVLTNFKCHACAGMAHEWSRDYQ